MSECRVSDTGTRGKMNGPDNIALVYLIVRSIVNYVPSGLRLYTPRPCVKFLQFMILFSYFRFNTMYGVSLYTNHQPLPLETWFHVEIMYCIESYVKHVS